MPPSSSSMTAIILNPLTQLQRLSQTLFLALSPAQSKPPPPPPISAFLECDASLAAALQLARVHQINQHLIEKLKDDVLMLDVHLREVWSELESGKRELEAVIKEGDERIAAIAKAKQGMSSAGPPK